MASEPHTHPLLYQINTQVVLHEIGSRLGRPATLDDIPDALLDDVAALGFDWLWPLAIRLDLEQRATKARR